MSWTFRSCSIRSWTRCPTSEREIAGGYCPAPLLLLVDHAGPLAQTKHKAIHRALERRECPAAHAAHAWVQPYSQSLEVFLTVVRLQHLKSLRAHAGTDTQDSLGLYLSGKFND